MLQITYTMHRGKVCRQQQDCILIDGAVHQVPMLPITALTLTADETLLAVADGVAASGGDRRIAPQQASRIVLEELAKAVRECPEWLREGFVANRHVRLAQARLSDKLADNPKTYGAASTLAVAHVRGHRAAILNVGDSRVYRASREGQWWRLSKDHTVLQDLLDRGEASPDTEYASLYGMLAHVLCADHEEGDFAIHRVRVTLEPGDTLVLCSDGIHDQIGEAMLWNLFDPALDVAAQAKVWRDAVWRDGAKDNLSLVVATPFSQKNQRKTEMPTVWEIGIGTEWSSYAELKERRVVAQGWSDTGDLSDLFGQPENIIRNDTRIKRQGADPTRVFANLLYWIKPGDLVIACQGTGVRGICEIGPDIAYGYDLDGQVSHVKPNRYNWINGFEYANCLYFVAWVNWSAFENTTRRKPPSIAGQGVRGIVKCGQDPKGIYDAWKVYKEITKSNTKKRENTMEYTTNICISIFDDFQQIILHGPPGTSKTYQAKRMAAKLMFDINDEEIDDLVNQEEKSGTGEFADKRFRIIRDHNKSDEYKGQWAIVQFHPAYNYEDFVRGIQVSGQDEKIRYENVQRIFSAMCKAAENNKDKKYVLIIDEINRAHIAAVLGELIYGLEYRNARITIPYAIEGDDTLSVPKNLYIIGTMNTADRSIGHIDYAVRRRFAFIACPPDPDVLENYYNNKTEALKNLAKLLFEAVCNVFKKENLNEFDLEDVCPGHTYFMAENEPKLRNKFIYQVYPLLREYYKDGILRQNVTQMRLPNGNMVPLDRAVSPHKLLDML